MYFNLVTSEKLVWFAVLSMLRLIIWISGSISLLGKCGDGAREEFVFLLLERY
jgi:hypothetical protein